jgi:hypothetical protein
MLPIHILYTLMLLFPSLVLGLCVFVLCDNLRMMRKENQLLIIYSDYPNYNGIDTTYSDEMSTSSEWNKEMRIDIIPFPVTSDEESVDTVPGVSCGTRGKSKDLPRWTTRDESRVGYQLDLELNRWSMSPPSLNDTYTPSSDSESLWFRRDNPSVETTSDGWEVIISTN